MLMAGCTSRPALICELTEGSPRFDRRVRGGKRVEAGPAFVLRTTRVESEKKSECITSACIRMGL